MKKLKLSTQNKNRILALAIGIIGCIFLSLFFDLFFDMNDDVFMKNILSGIYTGKPEGHNIQMLYPLAFVISLFYRMLPSISWYGLFLTGSIFLSFYLCITRGFRLFEKRTAKVIYLISCVIIYAGLLLWEMVFIQYTVVCGILAATAAINLFLTPKDISVKDFLKYNAVSVALVVIAFNLRTEMLLLMTPFLAIAGLLRWRMEEKFFSKESLSKYLTIIGSIAILILLSLGLNRLAYHSKEWQEFNAFFDARTNVYDFTWYPDYDENKEFYDSIGISKGQYNLIDNYNFGLDDRINSEVLNQVAQYQTANKNEQKNIVQRLKNVCWQYIYQLTHFDSSLGHETRTLPYGILIAILYLWLILISIITKNKAAFWQIPYMWICRSVPWFYVLFNGRVVARLTHSMYFIEIMIVIFLILTEWKMGLSDTKSETKKKKFFAVNIVFTGVSLVLLLLTIPGSTRVIQSEQERREEINRTDLAIKEYCRAHPNNYYYLDVYSSVTFSEKIFKDNHDKVLNYDILGGWVSKSPLTHQKEASYGITDIEKDLIAKDNIYFMAESTSDVTWIEEYFGEKGIDISVENADKLNSNLIINIYKVKQRIN